MDRWDFFLIIVSLLYIISSPYTKIEEELNTQAIHDIIYHGTNLDEYHHFEFPGVVPRTFISSFVTAVLSYPFKFIFEYKIYMLILTRFVIALFGIYATIKLRESIKKVFSYDVSKYFIIVQLCQFHFNYYISRPLPNSLVLPLVLLAYSHWLRGELNQFISYMTFATVIFRCELLALFAPFLLQILIRRQMTFKRMAILGIMNGILSLSLTILFDSIFWKRLLWPEGEVLYFNTYLNRSSEWGVSPFYWYFLIAIPKTMYFTLLLVPVGIYFTTKKSLTILFPVVLFVFLYSFLPHKELRFIFYAFPFFNICASVGLYRLQKLKNKIYFLFALCLLLGTLVISLSILFISSNNYPGGDGLMRLHQLEDSNISATIDIDIYSKVTGASRFGELNNNWKYVYDRKGFEGLTHLVTERKPHEIPQDFLLMEAVQGYDGIKISKIFPFINILYADKVYLYKRKTMG